MPAVTTYVSDFDTSNQTTQTATAQTGALSALVSDNNIAQNISLSDARAAFKIVTDNNFAATDSTGLFTTDATMLANFQPPADSDILHFTSKLSSEIFGFANGTGLLANEDAVKTDFITTFNNGVDTIEAGGDAAAGNAGCLTIFNQMKITDIGRFNLSHEAALPVAPTVSEDLTARTLELFTHQSGSGVKVISVAHGTPDTVTLTAAGTLGGYVAADIVWFIHPVTGQIYQTTLDAGNASDFNSSANTAIVITTFIAVTSATQGRVFNKFYIKGNNVATDATPVTSNTLALTVGAAVTDLTITTQNTLLQSDFSADQQLIMVSEGTSAQHPQSIVFGINGINSIQAAYLNNGITDAAGISLPFESGDILQFALTITSATGQVDSSSVAFSVNNIYGLIATLA